ncbi:MAG: MoxR family ATPase [Christensenellaceae bacterium]|nr:MoxR family ATPase [Christensenellaceae bacterium]
MNIAQGRERLEAIAGSISKVLVGKKDVTERVLIALLCGGHVLIEDVPGVGKTLLVTALAKSLGCSFARVQFTPDTLPTDITGFTLFDLQTGRQETRPGAIFAQIVLADEINRTSPKTQSALLEAMQEGQVSIEGQSHALPSPFMVLATQNPVELTGTYPLPEAQLDRFLLRVKMGYPSRNEEIEILAGEPRAELLREIKPVAGAEDVLALQALVGSVTRSPAILSYVVSIAEATRRHEMISLGVSPRGSLALLHASAARALIRGRDYVTPDDVIDLAEDALAHRLILSPQASFQNLGAGAIVKEIVRSLRVPIL